MELWDIYDIDKRFTGKVIDRHSQDKLKEGEYHLVVEAVIINSNGEILLSKRSELKNKYPNMWECTMGSCIKGENSLQAILRELREELGINFNEIWLLKKNLEIIDLKFTDGEVVDAKWINVDKFEKMINNKEIIPTIDFTKEDYMEMLKE